VRLDTYGEDLGQNSWLTADEWREIIGWTALGQGSRALDVGCGAGGPALHLAVTTGAQVLGIDSNADAVASANAMAAGRGCARWRPSSRLMQLSRFRCRTRRSTR
jgi:cyclopropane fatty-acyl-phospholipid synthase-like methyltransferase